jgi:hypothetical protein
MITELTISVVLIFLLATLLYPAQLFMPHAMHSFMVPLLIVLLILFGAVLWKETPGDEREQLHKLIAARVAYFAGIVTLTAAIIVQNILHKKIDWWLLVVMCIMLLGKVAGSLYAKIKK